MKIFVHLQNHPHIQLWNLPVRRLPNRFSNQWLMWRRPRPSLYTVTGWHMSTFLEWFFFLCLNVLKHVLWNIFGSCSLGGVGGDWAMSPDGSIYVFVQSRLDRFASVLRTHSVHVQRGLNVKWSVSGAPPTLRFCWDCECAQTGIWQRDTRKVWGGRPVERYFYVKAYNADVY